MHPHFPVQRCLMFSIASASGMLSMPKRCAVEERTNSANAKCSLSFVVRLFMVWIVYFVQFLHGVLSSLSAAF